MEILARDATDTVPVVVDDPGSGSNTSTIQTSAILPLVRCVYFAIESAQLSPNWQLGLTGRQMPFFMLGLSGIVFGTVEAAGAPSHPFLSPSDIEATFDFIEQSGLLIVETGRIYLPLEFINFMTNGRTTARDVLRVRKDVFVAAFEFAHSRMAEREFATLLDSYKSERRIAGTAAPLSTSSEETRAFSTWSKEQLETLRQQESVWESNQELHPKEDRSRLQF